MTKRESSIANLPTPGDPHMAFEHDVDLPMKLISGYAASSAPVPMPLPTGSLNHNFMPVRHCNTTSTVNEQFHTTTFKIFKDGNRAPELVVGEVDDVGYFRTKTPEVLFHGIAGHVRDRYCHRFDGWHQSAKHTSTRMKATIHSTITILVILLEQQMGQRALLPNRSLIL